MDRSYIIRTILFCCLSTVLRSFTEADPQLYPNEVDTSDNLGKKIFRPLQSRDISNMLLDKEKKLIYVGAVNFLYALDADDITIKRGEIHWAPEPFSLRTCLNFKGDSARCQNSIRVLHAVNESYIYACGTMAFSPTCTYIDKKDFTRVPGRGERGKWRAPQDPLSTTVSTMIDDCLFTATNLASQTKNGVIAKSVGDGSSLRTNENDDFCLSDPQFVSAFRVPDGNGQEKVFVLLKENAEEIPTEILTQDHENSYSIVYSRIVSICANDRGGNLWILKDKFATFSKMRIACPVPTNRGKNRRAMPFFYDEIQNSFVLPNPNDPTNPTVYTIFTTPSGAFEATATCVYEMNDIRKYFQTNKYWNKHGKSTNIYSTYDGPSETAPGECVADTSTLTTDRLTFGAEHPLKYGIVKPKEGYAVYQDAGKSYKHIVVDRIKRKEKLGSELVEREYDIVHYISKTGDIKRIVFYAEDRSQFWQIPFRNVFNSEEAKEKILTVRINDGYLYFGTDASVTQLPVAACSMYKTCSSCSSANDPYCSWNELKKNCDVVDFNIPTKRNLLFMKQHNTTSTCAGSDVNADKKSGDNEDARRDFASGEMQSLSIENEKLKLLSRKQNETIHYLAKRNLFFASKLTETMRELSILAKNYSHATTLLLQYNDRRKLVLQLYRNTVYSLHACQHEKTNKKLADKKKALEADRLAEKQQVTNATQVECKKSEETNIEENREGVEIRCDKEEEYLRLLASLRENIRSLEQQKESEKQSLASCLSFTSTLKEQVHDFEKIKQNASNLQVKVKDLQKKNLILKTGIASSGCGESEWFIYKPARKMYLITRETSGYARAQRFCRKINAQLVTMKTDDEARYVHDVSTKFSPRRRFWIGIEKHGNGTMTWSDGSVFNPVTSHRFSKSQNSRVSNSGTYCVETTQREGEWQLIPCNKSRRIMCAKDYIGVE